MTSDGPERRAVVVGGGLAGITAALRLADGGRRVTLLEGRPRLGGLAFSFRHGELWVDNGQHVFLRCCTAYRGLLARIGADHLVTLQRRLDVPVLDAARMRLGRLRRSAAPVPLHLAASLAGYPHLNPTERLSVARAALALRHLDPADPALDGTDFASWLRAHGQSPRTIEALWDLVGVATLNATADRTSLALAAMVFKTGLLSDPGASDIGWATAPLGRLHHDAALAALQRAGVRVRLRCKVAALENRAAGGHLVRLPDGTLEADEVVLAVPSGDAAGLLPADALDDAGRLRKIRTSPIVNLHVRYDRRVTGVPFFAAIGSPVQFVFDRTKQSGLMEGQYLALSQSDAGDLVDEPVAALRERFLPELARLLPAARDAKVLDFFVSRERTATFLPEPGVGALRPPARTRLPSLALAGAWTDTGWPATMEGAVLSGRAAAARLLSGTVPGARGGRP